MTRYRSDRFKHEVVLGGRILLSLLFFIFGWHKLANYSETVAYLGQEGTPFPNLAGMIAIIVEFLGSTALLAGIFTRALAIVFVLYTFATALIGHHYWTMTGATAADNMEHFFKNLSIVGGFLLLYVTGPGTYSLDAMPEHRDQLRFHEPR